MATIYRCDRCKADCIKDELKQLGLWDLASRDMYTPVVDLCRKCYSQFLEWKMNFSATTIVTEIKVP